MDMKFVFLLALACSAACGSTMAGTITNANPEELAAAIEGGGSIRLAFDGTVSLEKALLIATNTTVDASDHRVILDGGNLTRHFTVTNGATLRLHNLTLANGHHVGPTGETNQPGGPGWGGSIYNAGGKLELFGCNFVSNQVAGGKGGTGHWASPGLGGIAGPGFGGAISSRDGEVWATNCTFDGNICQGGLAGLSQSGISGRFGDGFGGAVYSTNGQVTLLGVTFTNNFVLGTSSGGGGFAQSGGTVLIRDSTFETNQTSCGTYNAASGGGVYISGGNATIERTRFALNLVKGGQGGSGFGGALFVAGPATLKLSTSALVFNRAIGGSGVGDVSSGVAWGGAMDYRPSLDGTNIARLVNCTLHQNSAIADLFHSGGSGLGGAIFTSAAQSTNLSLLNVTIAQNLANGGRDAYSGDRLPVIASIYGNGSIANTILVCEAGQTNAAGLLVDLGHNICSDASANFTLPSSRGNLDPRLGPLAENGGPTPTMALLPGSPAIDAGDDALAPATDQRGVPRPMGLASDIGAFELEPKLNLSRSAAGEVRLEYEFLPGQTNAISASADFESWETLSTGVTDSAGRFTFEDTQADQYPMRFYRVEGQR